MVEVSTSILNVKEGEETSTFLELEKAKTDYFHIDVMDGKFVEKNTYSKMLKDSSYIKRISNLPLDVHLMTYNVLESINDFAMLEPNIITFHYETCNNKDEVMECINCIKNVHSRVGISVKPNTDIKEIYPFLKFIHVVLIMTVEPGKGGQTFLSEMVKKIKECKKYITENNLEVDIEVDGGINLATMDKVKDAGANILVAGTAILKAKRFETIIIELKK